MENELRIRSSIVHLCDEELQEPVIGQALQSDDMILGYIEKHVRRILADSNLRLGKSKGENLVMKKYIEEGDLLAFSSFFASKAHKLFADNGLKGGDLLFFDGSHGEGQIVGMIKLDYKKGYIHQIGYDEGGISTTIAQHQSILPSPSQKIADAVVFYPGSGIAKLVSGRVNIAGEKDTVIDKIFDLEMDASLSEKVQMIEDAVSEVVAYYYDEDVRQNGEIEKVIAESIEETGAIDLDYVADRGFGDKPAAKQAFAEKVEEAGVDSRLAVNKRVERKYTKKRVMVADNGIEIHVPMECVNQNEFIEYQVSDDGRIQIVLKNIEKLEGK